MKKYYSLFMILIMTIWTVAVFGQGSTTAAINGKVMDSKGASLPGATILLHEPGTGTQYGTTTDDQGLFRLANVNPGGPYKVTISYVGFQPFINENIFLTLGQTLKIDAKLSEAATELTGVEVVGVRNDIFDGNRTGAETNVGRETIDRMPSVGRTITDFTRLTPQAKVNGDQALEIGGMNNRYNAIFIDGAVNNDVFGLAASGTNGGQIGLSPFSMDIIDQFTISIAPYDVKLGGFAGGSISAVTRRGTNEISGSAYYYLRNATLAGKTPTDNPALIREKLNDFSSSVYGFRLGGPILKDKVFFFANAEIQKDNTPQPFDFSTYAGSYTAGQINGLVDFVKNEYGYDPGSYQGTSRTLDGVKLFGRIDYNINDEHKLTFRHQYTYGNSILPGFPSKTNLYFSNAGQDFTSKTNSSTVELKSTFGNKFSNNIIFGLTFVRDDRDPMGDNFPFVRIKDGTSNIYFGSEEFSTANILNQDIVTLTDNFEIYKGTSTFTVGTHNEFYKMYNLFIRQNFGSYQYADMETFMNGGHAYQYDRTFSLVDNITGDGSEAAAKFNATQIGVYGQWEKQWTENFKTTLGIRLDLPMYITRPPENSNFNDTIIPLIEAAGWDMEGAKTGQMPRAKILYSPRFGFNWDVFNDKKTQVRGGVGIFTSRIPFVWPGGSYTNNGITTGGMRLTYDEANPDERLLFNPNWDNQPSLPAGKPSGQVDVFARDFKFPQVLRTSIAVDQKLIWGIVGTAEFTYSKILNNIMYYNVRYVKTDNNLTGTGDDRPIWTKVDLSNTNSSYTDIILGTNTQEGNSYNITLQLQKNDFYGFSGMFAYTYGQSTSMNDGVSSQNSSNWRVPNVRGKNDLDLGNSDFNLGSRIIAYVSYNIEYAKHLSTTISLYYTGQYAGSYSYGYNDGNTKFLGEDNQDLELMYVPKDANDIHLVNITNSDGEITLSKEQQWTDLNTFIEGNDYLSTRRGMYAERNASHTPFENIIDLHISQNIFMTTNNGKRNTLQITFDVFNFTNMLNKNWGRRYYVSGYYGNYPLLNFAGFEEDGTTPTFTFEKPKGDIWSIDDSGLNSSRWQGQIGIRYIFN